MNPSDHDDYFALFDLPRRLHLDLEVLQKRYETLQKHYHPDRFSQGSATEQRLAQSMSATINNAYQTLKTPSSRVAHLLSLQGIHVAQKSLDNKILLDEQWQWREQLEEVNTDSEVAALTKQIQQQLSQIFEKIDNFLSNETSLSQPEQQIILQNFHRLQFFTKLLQEVEKKQRSMM
jgi:molecular chaperone HscB